MTIVTVSLADPDNNGVTSSFGWYDALPRILSVSCDSSLVTSRELVLRSFGLDVTSTLCVPDALELCKSNEFSLLIVGHTVPDKAKTELISLFRERCQGTVLVLHTPFQAPWEGANYTFDVHGGPSQLAALVCDLTNKEPDEQLSWSKAR